MHIIRYNANGTVDSTFGTNGIVTTGNYVQTILNAPDGKIVTGTTSANGLINAARYLNNNVPAGNKPFDFDADGKTDIGIFRPAAGEWWINSSLTNQTFALQFGVLTE